MVFGFGKSITCQRCGSTIEKGQVNSFDSTIRGHNTAGESLKVCGNCLIEKFNDSLKSFNSRAVVVYPTNSMGWMTKPNAYQFYSFEEMDSYGWEEDFITSLDSLLPSVDTKCSLCGDAASFAWVSPEIYFNDYSSGKLNQKGNYEEKFLCTKCLLREFKKKFIEGNLKFDEFLPPVEGESFGTPFEA